MTNNNGVRLLLTSFDMEIAMMGSRRVDIIVSSGCLFLIDNLWSQSQVALAVVLTTTAELVLYLPAAMESELAAFVASTTHRRTITCCGTRWELINILVHYKYRADCTIDNREKNEFIRPRTEKCNNHKGCSQILIPILTLNFNKKTIRLERVSIDEYHLIKVKKRRQINKYCILWCVNQLLRKFTKEAFECYFSNASTKSNLSDDHGD